MAINKRLRHLTTSLMRSISTAKSHEASFFTLQGRQRHRESISPADSRAKPSQDSSTSSFENLVFLDRRTECVLRLPEPPCNVRVQRRVNSEQAHLLRSFISTRVSLPPSPSFANLSVFEKSNAQSRSICSSARSNRRIVRARQSR